MLTPDRSDDSLRHPSLWIVEVTRWDYRRDDPRWGQPTSEEDDEDHAIFRGDTLDFVYVQDRPSAVAAAHQFLDQYASEPAGKISLEVHIYPPEQDLEDESVYQITPKALEQARALGLEADIEGQIKRMACDATAYSYKQANVRLGRFTMRLEGNTVTWVGALEPRRRRRKTK